MLNIFGLAEWEIFPGYTLGSFAWYIDLFIIGIAVLVVSILVFLFVFMFGYLAKDEEKGKKTLAKTKKVSKIFTPIVAALLVISLAATPVLTVVWEPMWKAITGNAGVVVEIDNESTRMAAAEATQNVIEIEKEGIVLLRNKDNVLPLDKDGADHKVNIFGAGAFGILYGNAGSGAFQTTERRTNNYERNATKLETAMEEEGFEYNKLLWNLVANYYPKYAGDSDTANSDRASRTPYSVADSDNRIENGVNTYGYAEIVRTCLPYNHEPEVSAYEATYSDDRLGGKTLLEYSKEYSDTAIFAISRFGTESEDMKKSEMQLKERERAVIEMLVNNFDKVIILLNIAHEIEIGELVEMGVDAIVMMGHPGLTGCTAVAQVLSGTVNPSGKLANTWAYDATSAPSYQSFGNDTTQSYTGASGYFNAYREGIYVGYRYYATRAMTDNSFNYDENVQYSFGYGLSYTTFNKFIQSHSLDKETGEVKVTVGVTNTGKVAGKEVIELYTHAPYQAGGIEKAWYNLAAFKKTPLIQPNETKYYELSFTLRDIASWDSEKAYYVLEPGEYEVSLRNDVWHQAEDETGVHETSFTFNQANLIEYTTSYETGYPYSSQFAEAEYGPYANEPMTYLSRNDWEGTWKNKADISKAADKNKIDPYHNIATSSEMKNDYQIDEDLPQTGIDSGLTLRDLKDADWDDPNWDLLLDQMSRNEMYNLVDNGGFQTSAVPSISKAKSTDYDGPAATFHYGTGHPSEVVLANTWNVEAALLFGESVGKEGAANGITGWYAPGINTHRSPYGGRNFEYYSEDPLIGGNMAGYTSKGTMEYGVYCYAKHFALNEQEYQRSGLDVWASEQAIREIYLRGFEIYVNLGGIGIMTSFNRVGSTWSGAHRGLCTEVLRNEWGFHGVVVTDYVSAGNLMPVNAGIRAGNDLWLNKNGSYSASAAYNECPHDALIYLRRSCKNILYACAHSNNVWDDADWAAVGMQNPNSK